MKLINQIIIKADCVEFFLRSLIEAGYGGNKIIDVIMQPQRYQNLFDEYRDAEYNDHPMDRPNKIGKVKDLLETEPDECAKYHAEQDMKAMGMGGENG